MFHYHPLPRSLVAILPPRKRRSNVFYRVTYQLLKTRLPIAHKSSSINAYQFKKPEILKQMPVNNDLRVIAVQYKAKPTWVSYKDNPET